MQVDARSAPTGAADGLGLGGTVRTTVGRLYRRFRSERADGDLGDTALEVLGWLEKNGPQSLTELSRAGRVAPASMSQSVNRLTSAGYAMRTPDPSDRRKVLFSTTTAGVALAVQTRSRRDAWLNAALCRLSLEDQAVIARACALFRSIADS